MMRFDDVLPIVVSHDKLRPLKKTQLEKHTSASCLDAEYLV